MVGGPPATAASPAPRPGGHLDENGRGTVPGGTAGEGLVRDHSEYVVSILSQPATELRLIWDLGNIHLASKGATDIGSGVGLWRLTGRLNDSARPTGEENRDLSCTYCDIR